MQDSVNYKAVVKRGHAKPLQPLLQQRQVLFQPPDLLPLDAGDVSVPVHVPERTGHTHRQSGKH